MCIFTILALLASFLFLFLYISEHLELKEVQEELEYKNKRIDQILSDTAITEMALIKVRKEYYKVRSQYLTSKKVNKKLRGMIGSLSKKKKIK